MLEIPANTLFKKNKAYNNLADIYLPGAGQHSHILTAIQSAYLKELDGQISKEKFYILTDVKSGEITRCNGINHWLGYPDREFSKKKFLHIVSPAHAAIQHFFAAALFSLFLEMAKDVQFLNPVFIGTISLKSINGQYYYCKRESVPFQLTAQNKIASYLSEFTIIKKFANEDYHLRLLNGQTQNIASINFLELSTKKNFETGSAFSFQELRILKKYAQSPTNNSQSIAKSYKIEKGTVDTYNKRIMKKAESIYCQKFENARKVAEYFKRLGLI